MQTSESKISSQRSKSKKPGEENKNPNEPSRTRNHLVDYKQPLTQLDLISITTQSKTVDLIDSSRSRKGNVDSAVNESRIRKDNP